MSFRRPPPYFSQWGSLEASRCRILDGGDPSRYVDWAAQGFRSLEEYRLWSDSSCGVSCIQSILAAAGQDVPPKAHLIDELVEAGAYQLREGAITGLVYEPCVQWVRSRWHLGATSHRHLTIDELRGYAREGSLVIASVSKEIRWPARTPTLRGGHLVLVFDASDTTLTLHNPSGLRREDTEDGIESARGAIVSLWRFEEFFAHRGMVFTVT